MAIDLPIDRGEVHLTLSPANATYGLFPHCSLGSKTTRCVQSSLSWSMFGPSLGPGSVILFNHHLLDFISAVNPSALSLAFSGTSLPLPAPLRDPLCFLHTSTPHSPTAQPKLGRPPQRLCRNHLPRLRSPLRCNHTPVSFQLHAVPSPNLYHNRQYLFLLTDTRSSRYFRSAVPVSFSFFRDPAALSLIRPLENDRRRVTDRPLCVRLGLPPPGR